MVAPGVVGMAEVVQPSSTVAGKSTGQPFMWSMIWVALAALFLVFIHLAMMGRGR
jgi:ABC-type arginine transport system permease subunit